MTTTFIAVIAFAVSVAALTLGAIVYRQNQTLLTRAADLPGNPAADIDPIIAGPPQVRGDTVRDWLMHYTRGRFTWADAVAEFYRRAAADPEVASYFHATDLPQLQRHFTAAIIIVTSKGLTAKTVVRMAQVHAGVRDEQGRAITGEVYDKVVDVLKAVLRDMGVPGGAVDDLEAVVAPLRGAIVSAGAALPAG